MSAASPILLAGCGKMGMALLQGWEKTFPGLDVIVIEPNGIPDMPGVRHMASPDLLPENFAPAMTVLAVKPQIMKDVCAGLNKKLAPQAPILSIAAGKTLGFFANALGAERPVVRAMPNTPAAIGHGVSVLCANSFITPEQRHMAGDLLGAAGLVSWVEDESLMDIVTAVSGSGPAYVFLLIEELAKAGANAGMPEELAMMLARQTVIGSAYLAENESDTSISVLRQNVTSPRGTTEAALEVLMGQDGLAPLLAKALVAHMKRSRELAD